MQRALPLVLLLLIATARADDEGLPPVPGSREITEDMIKACPELKTATGRKRDQLLALHFDLDVDKAQTDPVRAKVRGLFDLTKPEDASVIEGVLEARGAYRAQTGVRTVVAASGPKGLVWVVGRFEKIKPEGKGRLVDSLVAVKERESWRFLEKLLDDQTPVPDWRARNEAPPGYKDLRVCDWAFRTIGSRCIDVIKLPDELKNGAIASMTPIDERNERVKKLKEFLASDKDYLAHVAKQPATLPALDEAPRKEAKALFERLGIATD